METQGLDNPKPLTGFDDADIAGFFSANDDHLIFTMDIDGNEAFSLYKVNREGKPKIVEVLFIGALVMELARARQWKDSRELCHRCQPASRSHRLDSWR